MQGLGWELGGLGTLGGGGLVVLLFLAPGSWNCWSEELSDICCALVLSGPFGWASVACL